ncbi:MAG: alpha-E domain-containing protein [Terracidiphilus sp.]
MLSRVADSLYWMSRYLERAENTVRLLDVTMGLMLDSGGVNSEQRWKRMTAALGRKEGIEWNGSLESMSRKLVFDQVDPSSITYCISAARENARQVREEISTEQWQRLNRLYHQIHSPNADAQFRSSVSEMLGSVVDGIYLFKGTTDTTMIHGQGWQFIRLGRYLERAYATATLLEVFQPELFQHPAEERAGHLYLELVGLLRCCTSFEAYCQVYTADLSPDRILEFLLFNREFPHAICYCVEGARQAIEAIQESGGRRAP